MLGACKSAVVLSGYDSPLYRELYGDWEMMSREIANHAAGGREKARQVECLWIKPARVRRAIREESNSIPIGTFLR